MIVDFPKKPNPLNSSEFDDVGRGDPCVPVAPATSKAPANGRWTNGFLSFRDDIHCPNGPVDPPAMVSSGQIVKIYVNMVPTEVWNF